MLSQYCELCIVASDVDRSTKKVLFTPYMLSFIVFLAIVLCAMQVFVGRKFYYRVKINAGIALLD